MKRLSTWTGALLLAGSGLAVNAQEAWVETSGDVLQIMLPLTALAATYGLNDPEGRTQLLMSYTTTALVTQLGKAVIDKPRPDGSDLRSFPSGHTSSAFSGAAFLTKRYGWDVGVPAYLAASWTGYSRVYADKHDWWDVGAGALLAIAVNEWLVDRPEDLSLSLYPVDKGFSLAFAVRY